MQSDTGKYNPEEIRKMIVGLDTKVEIEGGAMAQAINFDNGATAPPFKQVAKEIEEQMLMYGSIGRGTGQKSKHSSEVYTKGRQTVLKFVGADNGEYTALYVNCTTDGMNKLASALVESPRDYILTTRMEHHANDLPWRERARTVYVDVKENGRLKIEDYENILTQYGGKIKLVCVTAASNVTGFVNEVHKIAKIAHAHGAKIVVDGAQIVAHRKFSMIVKETDQDREQKDNIDFFVFSAHKMYSPFGGGAVVGLTEVLDKRLPVFYGGGMVDRVTDYDVDYSRCPDRYEAGSPNYPGVVGMLKAIETLEDIGFDYIEQHEKDLLSYALKRLMELPHVILYGDLESFDNRVGTIVFNLKFHTNDVVAEYLACHSAIAVRHAKFCAHPYVNRLLGLVKAENAGFDKCAEQNGLVRLSFGVYNTEDEVDELIKALNEIPANYAVARNIDKMNAIAAALPNDRG